MIDYIQGNRYIGSQNLKTKHVLWVIRNDLEKHLWIKHRKPDISPRVPFRWKYITHIIELEQSKTSGVWFHFPSGATSTCGLTCSCAARHLGLLSRADCSRWEATAGIHLALEKARAYHQRVWIYMSRSVNCNRGNISNPSIKHRSIVLPEFGLQRCESGFASR